MRNLYDQYSQPENRLTHALVSSLSNDKALLKSFVKWATGSAMPSAALVVTEQTVPGEREPEEEDEAERRGLPDGCIYDGTGWALLIESKIEAQLTTDQLDRHRRTAERHGFSDIHLLAIVTELPLRSSHDRRATVKKWTELYTWARQERGDWASRLTSYMEVLEQKLVRDDYLRGGTLTVFAGIPFGKEQTYTYNEAKRLLRLSMQELRKRSDLRDQLGMDAETPGRSAITGRDGTQIWDFLCLRGAKEAQAFTQFPHLTLSIQREQLLAIVTIPHGIRPEFRANLLARGRRGFLELLRVVGESVIQRLRSVEGSAPWVEVVQRRYPSQRSEPIVDARLQFDLRTALEGHGAAGNSVKLQQQWLNATYDALAEKKSNLQVGVGAIFNYERCPVIHSPAILDYVAAAWLSCAPLINALVGSRTPRTSVAACP